MKTKITKEQIDTYPRIENELSYAEYKKAYDEWTPKDNISFSELLEKVIPLEFPFLKFKIEKIDLLFQFIFDQIKNGNDRKKALVLFLEVVRKYDHNKLIRNSQKQGKYFSYHKDHKVEINKNIKSAKKTQASLIADEMDNKGKTEQLWILLNEYIEQCEQMKDNTNKIIEPLKIKDYKLYNKRTKESIKLCLKSIVKEFSIEATASEIKTATDSL